MSAPTPPQLAPDLEAGLRRLTLARIRSLTPDPVRSQTGAPAGAGSTLAERLRELDLRRLRPLVLDGSARPERGRAGAADPRAAAA